MVSTIQARPTSGGDDRREVDNRRVTVVTSIAPPDYAGGGLSAYKLASRLSRTGQLAFLLTRSPATGRNGRTYTDLRGLPEVPAERIVRVASPGRARSLALRVLTAFVELPALAVTTAWQLARRRQEYDILHCFTANWLSFFAICVGAVLRKRTMLELTLLGRDDPGASAPRDLFGVKKTAKRIQFRLVHGVICLSPALVERCLEAGIPSGKLHLIPRPVDVNRFLPPDREGSAERTARLGLSGKWPIVLFVGGVSKRKGADLLLPIFSRIVREHPRALLLIIGTHDDKQLEEKMLAEIRQLGLMDAVRFVERTARIEAYMREATVFLLPTRREGFANVLVEAMACGVPVVTRLIPGITDFIIDDGSDGLLLDGDDPDLFARSILELVQDGELRRRIGAAGRQTAYTRFGTEIIDDLYRDVYQRLTPAADQTRGGAVGGFYNGPAESNARVRYRDQSSS